jgi:hypothetical protein
VGDVSGSVVALYDPQGATLASMGPDRQLHPLARFDQPCRPYRVLQRDGELEFLAVPRGRQEGQGIYHFTSSGQGQKWDRQLIPCRAEQGAANLGGDGRGLALDGEGRLLVLS